MTELQAFKAMWVAVWDVFLVEIDVPVIGVTSPLLMMVYLGILSLLVYFINGLYGNGE